MYCSTIDYVAIGQRLRAYRVAAALKAEDIGKNLQLSRAAVYRLEKGEIVKIETLDRLAVLLGTSLPSLLGVDTEYYASGTGFFERMRQLEARATEIYAHFDPFSFLLMSPDYLDYLQVMLHESTTFSTADRIKIESSLAILCERKSHLNQHMPFIYNLIGLHHIERFLHIGLVGNLNLTPSQKMERVLLARKEVQHLIGLIENNRFFAIAVSAEMVPSSTFQIFYAQKTPLSLGVSPFRLGEFPNITTGIASITASSQAIAEYKQLFDRLWQKSFKGDDAIVILKKTLDRY